MILKNVAERMSPCGRLARLSILIFHRVLSAPDVLFPGEPDVRRFNEILSWVARFLNVIPLDQAVAGLSAGTLPARAAVITFDDGYADNAVNALPILQRHGMNATFFVATSFLDGGRMWNDSVIEMVRGYRGKTLNLSEIGLGSYELESVDERRFAIDALLRSVKYLEAENRSGAIDRLIYFVGCRLPTNLMMSSEQVLSLRNAGMQIGAHTCSHPILERIADAQAVEEIRGSKLMLESLLSEPVSLFAYPNGKPDIDYSARHVAMVREAGFTAAVSTSPGVSMQRSDVYQLPRFTPWDRTRIRYGIRMLANLRLNTPHVSRLSSSSDSQTG